MVERGPEKAGVGGSIPSLATIPFNNFEPFKQRVKISRAYNTRTSLASHFIFGAARSNVTFHEEVVQVNHEGNLLRIDLAGNGKVFWRPELSQNRDT